MLCVSFSGRSFDPLAPRSLRDDRRLCRANIRNTFWRMSAEARDASLVSAAKAATTVKHVIYS